MAIWAQTYFLNTNSIILFLLVEYHNLTMFLMSNILMFLLVTLFQLLMKKNMFHTNPWKEENKVLEILWTIFPAYWLIMLAVPSLGNLYRMDLSKAEYSVLFKAIGNQWYWGYEYNMSGLGDSTEGLELPNENSLIFMEKSNFSPNQKDFSLSSLLKSNFKSSSGEGVSFVSYMESWEDLSYGGYRLLEVDNRVVCPGLMDIRVHITSFDVIHSWSVPSLSMKVDAVPGRLNCATFKTFNYGVYYGQCSEMCGAKHSFMPICLEAIPFNWFCLWYKEFQGV